MPARNQLRAISVTFVLALGTFLRFHAMDRQSLWDDEMSTIQMMSLPRSQWIHRFETYETHPPFYFAQLKLWEKAGARSLVRLRANSALWGSLSLFLIFWLGRRYAGFGAGLLSMSYAALSPYHLAYSQELRPYALSMVLALAAMLVLERCLASQESEGIPWWFLLGIFWTLLLYTHYWGAFVVTAQAVYAGCKIPDRKMRLRLAVTLAVIGALFSLWLPVLRAQLGLTQELAFWVPPFSIGNLLKSFPALSGLVFNMASGTFYLPGLFGVLLLLAVAQGTALTQGVRKGPLAMTLWLSLVIGIPWLLSLWKSTIYLWWRYPIHAFPAFAILVAVGILACRPRWVSILLLLICLGTQGWGALVYFTRWQKANPKAVVAYAHHLKQPETVVVRPSYFAYLFNFYDRGTLPVINEDLLDSPAKRAALKGRKILFIAFDVPSDPIADAFLNEFKVVTARRFPGIARLGITVYELE